jgi:small subunit ribosomal protein S9
MAKQFKKPARNKIQKVIKKAAPVSARSGKQARTHVALPAGEFIATIGRRKTATARVRLYTTSGDYVVNETPMTEYYASVMNPEDRFLAPFRVTDTLGKYAVSVKVNGSGISSQLDAAVLGIARALIKIDPGFKKALRDAGLVTRDARMKESRKPNTGGKARRKRSSPRR